jgi:hypothetical protein
MPCENRQVEAKAQSTKVVRPVSDASGDCGKCKHCLDKPKFGGPNKLHQRCENRPQRTPRASQIPAAATPRPLALVDVDSAVETSGQDVAQPRLTAPALTREERKLQVELHLFEKLELLEGMPKSRPQPPAASVADGLLDEVHGASTSVAPTGAATSVSVDAVKRSLASEEQEANQQDAKRSRAGSTNPMTDAFGDCGTCRFCRDKPRYGGKGVLRQICVLKEAAKAASKKSGAAKLQAEPSIAPSGPMPGKPAPPIKTASGIDGVVERKSLSTKVVRPADSPALPIKKAPNSATRFASDTSADCGMCRHCLDKPKNGGPNTLRKPCLNRPGPKNSGPPLDDESPAQPVADAFGDCGTCKFCLDKRRYGGQGVLRQICVLKEAAKAASKTSGAVTSRGDTDPQAKPRTVTSDPKPASPIKKARSACHTAAGKAVSTKLTLPASKPALPIQKASSVSTPPANDVSGDCGKCKHCLDKPKYGGPNKLHQRCENRPGGKSMKAARPVTQHLPKGLKGMQTPHKNGSLLNSGVKRAGERISVYWPLDDRCYSGTVTEVDSDEPLLLVKYDESEEDGSDAVFWACLDEGRWQCRWMFNKHEKDLAKSRYQMG